MFADMKHDKNALMLQPSHLPDFLFFDRSITIFPIYSFAGRCLSSANNEEKSN